MIQIHRWGNTTRQCSQIPIDQLPKSANEIPKDDVIWIDLADPTLEEEKQIFEQFLKVHSLTLEDITKPHRENEQGAHLPKVEEFPDYLFVIVNPLPRGLAEAISAKDPKHRATNEELRLLRRRRPQLSAIITDNVLITHHYDPLACTDECHDYVDRHGQCAERGPDFLFHLILDSMVDEYAPVVDSVSAQLDRLESRVFHDPSPRILQRMLRIKRQVTGLRKTLILEREVLARLMRGEFGLINDREVAYYRNVYDHLVRYTELIESAREMVSDLMETHLSAASHRLNTIMKVLTLISTIVLPMTLIAGIYGMNFEQNVWPDFKSPWGFWFAIGLMAATGFFGFAWFRWKRWA